MDTNQVSPVTESEMRDFQAKAQEVIGKMLTALVSHTDQAREIDTLRNQVTAINARVDELLAVNGEAHTELSKLRQSNDWLSQSAADNAKLAELYASERDEAKRVSTELGEANAKQGAMIAEQRDKIERSSLEQIRLGTERDTALNDRDHSERALRDAYADNDRLTAELKAAEHSLATIRSALGLTTETPTEPSPQLHTTPQVEPMPTSPTIEPTSYPPQDGWRPYEEPKPTKRFNSATGQWE